MSFDPVSYMMGAKSGGGGTAVQFAKANVTYKNESGSTTHPAAEKVRIYAPDIVDGICKNYSVSINDGETATVNRLATGGTLTISSAKNYSYEVTINGEAATFYGNDKAAKIIYVPSGATVTPEITITLVSIT